MPHFLSSLFFYIAFVFGWRDPGETCQLWHLRTGVACSFLGEDLKVIHVHTHTFGQGEYQLADLRMCLKTWYSAVILCRIAHILHLAPKLMPSPLQSSTYSVYHSRATSDWKPIFLTSLWHIFEIQPCVQLICRTHSTIFKVVSSVGEKHGLGLCC